MKYEVIIPSAGAGKRMGAGQNKLFLNLFGEAIIARTVRVFAEDPTCLKIILPINPAEKDTFIEKFTDARIKLDKIEFIEGGLERQYSVKNGLKALTGETEIVLVHDGARPFVTKNQITGLVEAATIHGGTVLAARVKDTIKKAVDNFVEETIERDCLWSMQTPQAFRVEILKSAHKSAEEKGFLGTDESSLVEKIGEKVYISEGDYENIKLTTEEDIIFAEAILRKRGS